MTAQTQPEALEVAELLDEARSAFGDCKEKSKARGAAELRRLHSRVQELEAQVQRAAESERAAILLRVKNRAVAGALLVEDVRAIVADRGPAAQAQRAPLTEEQMRQTLLDTAMAAVPEEEQDTVSVDEQMLETVTLFARAVERAHGITQEKQG